MRFNYETHTPKVIQFCAMLVLNMLPTAVSISTDDNNPNHSFVNQRRIASIIDFPVKLYAILFD